MLPKQIRTEKLDRDFFSDGEGVTCMLRQGDSLVVAGQRGLYRFTPDARLKYSGYMMGVFALAECGGLLFVAAGSAVHVITGSAKTELPFDRPVKKLAAGGNAVYALTENALYRYNGADFDRVQDVDFKPVDLAVTPDGVAWVLCEHTLHKLFAKRERFGSRFVGMTGMPAAAMRCLTVDSLGMLWLGTDDGVYLYDGRSEWIAPELLPAFPRCPINGISFGNEAVFFATPVGLYAATGSETAFYGKGRYLLDDHANCAFEMPDGTLYIGTAEGLSILRFEKMTLAEKEAYFRSLIPHFTRESYVTKRVGTQNGDLTSGVVQITDNDGLFTADWVVIESMRYALTGDESARRNARTAMRGLWKLETVSGIPGFPARAYRRPGEDRFGNGDPEWHLTKDDVGPVEWKGETSSDELVGHFWASAWYYDLAADEDDRRVIAENLGAITEHILTHGYTLCDADGLPTSWAHFGPEDLNADESWCWEKGVNALELLSFLLIAHHVTGNDRYLSLRQDLIRRHHYALNMLCYKKDDAHSSHIDDRLTAYIGTHFARYESDPALLRLYRLALRRHYEYIRDEQYVYAMWLRAFVSGDETDLSRAKNALAEYPLDLGYHVMDLSIRPDAPADPRAPLFGEAPHAAHPFRIPERVTAPMHEGGTDFACDHARTILSPCSWLTAYWTGRYFGFLSESD